MRSRRWTRRTGGRVRRSWLVRSKRPGAGLEQIGYIRELHPGNDSALVNEVLVGLAPPAEDSGIEPVGVCASLAAANPSCGYHNNALSCITSKTTALRVLLRYLAG
jgi:hypothetical protein